MNLCDDHEETDFFVIDVFNDVTAHTTDFSKAWDLQAKASKTSCAKTIGRELVTLFKNYLSDFHFDYSILFIGGVPESFRNDNNKNTFLFKNIEPKAQVSLKSGLIEEAKEKTYIETKDLTDKNVDDFLNKVTFVIDDKDRIEYLKTCIHLGKHIIPREAKLERMFSSIRALQSSLKERETIEGKTLNQICDSLFLNRHLNKNKIKLKILSDIIGDSFSKEIVPNHFIDFLNKFELKADEREDLIEECYLNLCKVYFDINNENNFWRLFSHIYSLVNLNKEKNVEEIYELSNKNFFKQVRDLQPNTAKYFISLIMETSL